jgi:uncharacterized integral membrane protein (TIGR00698 family)
LRVSERTQTRELLLWLAARRLYPGIALCVVLALAGSFLAEHYGTPALLLVLLLGFGFASQGQDERLQPGVGFCSRQLLRIGVALLGARIGFEQVLAVGTLPLLMVLTSVPLTIGAALLLGRWLGLPRMQSLVAGVAVAICGVSAAIAVAAVIPAGRLEERRLLAVVVGVTAMGTLAMLAYPPLLVALGYSDIQAGLLLGASVHDVAQAAGAGYLVSDPAGDVATLTKLLRVALLAPLVVLLGLMLRREEGGKSEFPWFLIGFLALFAANSLGWLPETLRQMLVSASAACLLATMAALGMRTSLGALLAQGWKPMLLIFLMSLLLLAFATGSLALFSL